MRARKAGLINIFVSNGYDTPETVAEMPKFLDCVTVDFKGSGETTFVRKYINIPNAEPIFQTLLDTRDTKKIHIEITDLIIPQVGDDLGAARKLSKWVYDNLGPDTPIHFLRFHPDYKMMEFPWTPVETLEKHCAVAKEEGLKYVYIGNVSGHPLENTYCPGCGAIAIKRYGFDITGWYLDKDNKCKQCGDRSAIVTRSGVPVAWVLPDDAQVDNFATMAATLLGALEVMYATMKRNAPNRVTVVADGGILTVHGVTGKMFFVALTEKQTAAFGKAVADALSKAKGLLGEA